MTMYVLAAIGAIKAALALAKARRLQIVEAESLNSMDSDTKYEITRLSNAIDRMQSAASWMGAHPEEWK